MLTFLDIGDWIPIPVSCLELFKLLTLLPALTALPKAHFSLNQSKGTSKSLAWREKYFSSRNCQTLYS